MSPIAARRDRGGEARSKRGGRWGHGGAHRGGGGSNGAAAIVRLAGMDTMLRKERRGDGVLGRVLVREDERGKEKGGRGGDKAPYIGDTAVGGGWATGGTMRRRGVGGMGLARHGRQWPSHSALMQCVTGVRIG
jgi:hypothetical protein